MQIEYLDDEARRAAMPPGVSPAGWTHAEVTRLRLVVQCIRAGQDARDVLSLRSLGLRADPDDPARAMADLSADRALALTFKADSRPVTAMLDIVPTRTEPRG
jgi:hypothetical protein